MRLLEAIIDANHRALAGDQQAGLHPAEYQSELPIVALTCVDPRLNALLPQALGIPAEQFIWLRNAGNIITAPLSSTMRSVALALAVKGGKELAVIGHTDCQVAKTTTMQLLDRLHAMGIERHMLPDNLTEYFGVFGSERQNIIKAAQIARSSPLIGPNVYVHGLLIDINTGKLEWIVNGYETLERATAGSGDLAKAVGQTVDAFKALGDFKLGDLKFPETKIGEIATQAAEQWLSNKARELEAKVLPGVSSPQSSPPPATPPKIALPPPIRPRLHLRRNPKQ